MSSTAARTTAQHATQKTTSQKTAQKPATRRSRSAKPKLRVVDQAAHRRRVRHRALVSLSVMAVAATLFAVALIYAQLVTGQQEIDDLRAEIAEAEAHRAGLERSVAVASTPDAIVARAVELGMVRAVDPQYLVAVRSIEETDGGS